MKWLDWLGAVGSVASLIGLGITWYVARAVRQLRQRYVKQAVMKAASEN